MTLIMKRTHYRKIIIKGLLLTFMKLMIANTCKASCSSKVLKSLILQLTVSSLDSIS